MPSSLLTNPCAAILQGIDSWIHVSHLKKAPNPYCACIPTGKPENKNFQELKKTAAEEDSFPKMTGPDLYAFLSLLSLALSWKDNTLIFTFQSPEKGGNLSDCWICHEKLWSVQESNDPFVHPISNFAGIPRPTLCLNCSAGPFYKISELNPPNSAPCFSLTQSWNGKVKSLEYTYVPLGSSQYKLGHCQLAGSPSICTDRISKFWLNDANASIMANGSRGVTTYKRALCTSPSYSFVCGGLTTVPVLRQLIVLIE